MAFLWGAAQTGRGLKELKAFIVSDQAKRSASGCQGTVMLLEGTLTCDVRRRGCLRDLFFCSMG